MFLIDYVYIYIIAVYIYICIHTLYEYYIHNLYLYIYDIRIYIILYNIVISTMFSIWHILSNKTYRMQMNVFLQSDLLTSQLEGASPSKRPHWDLPRGHFEEADVNCPKRFGFNAIWTWQNSPSHRFYTTTGVLWDFVAGVCHSKAFAFRPGAVPDQCRATLWSADGQLAIQELRGSGARKRTSFF